jgi:hypothetical protein
MAVKKCDKRREIPIAPNIFTGIRNTDVIIKAPVST